jgi:uncharacterized protein YndB with AHSA1/START domain
MTDETYTIERSTTIEAPPERIYSEIVDFHQWTNWSPWEGGDPKLKRNYSGAESGTGAVYSWSGNRKSGLGRMEITKANEPYEVQIDLAFIKPFRARNDIRFAIVPEGSGSRVTWTMTGKQTLMTKMMAFFTTMDKVVGPDFERGLAQLKTRSEAPD